MAEVQQSGTFGAPLEAVVFNEDLRNRRFRAPQYEVEIRALSVLIQQLADSPQTILQALTDQMLEVFGAHSAGISLLTTKDDEERFYWPAISGQWKCFIGGGTPRNFGPCGDVLDRNTAFLFRDLELRYSYYSAATPRVVECLLVPFYLKDEAVGTLWIVAHDDKLQFDSEDLRLMESLGRFAATAFRTTHLLSDLEHKTEKLEAANTDLSQFAHIASHDLQEPLRDVKISSERLLKYFGDKLDGDQRVWLSAMVDGCTRMNALLADLLSYAQATGAGHTIDEIADLNTAFDTALGGLRAAIAESQAVVTRDDLPVVRAHTEHFTHMFQNLVANSIKYRSEARPIVHLSVLREGDNWHFVLKDNGVGIDTEFHQRIFEAFTRLHGREIAGTGLGLAICRRVVERVGGRIWVDSKAGEGAEFHFTAPVTVISKTGSALHDKVRA